MLGARWINVAFLLAIIVFANRLAAGTAKPQGLKLPAQMSSSKMIVRFDDQTHAPSVITRRERNDSLALIPESAFRLELDKLEGTSVPAGLAETRPSVIIDARQCEIVAAEQTESADRSLLRKIVYHSLHGEISVEYRLGPDDHFFQKSIRFTPAFPEAYLLRRVCVDQYRFAETPENLVSFRHGRCVTHFVRRQSTGFFFGVQVPIEVNVPDPSGSIELYYDANYRYPSKATYAAETVFWGVYLRTGVFAPAVPSRIDECDNSTAPPDLGESAAMLAMVRRLIPPRPVAVAVNYNCWEGGLSRNGYGSGATEADVANDQRILAAAKEQFGSFLTYTTMPWGGMARDMPTLGRDAHQPLSSPLQQELIQWARRQQIKLGTWAPMKGICPWEGLFRYCPEYPSWFGRHEGMQYNCPASRSFMEWYTRLLVVLIRRDRYDGFGLDEHGPSPRTGLPCSSSDHDHLPGDASYGYFVARRELHQTLRREFGPDFVLEDSRPTMDTGVWDTLYADYCFTLSENKNPGGDEVRYRSRVRHFYHFFPSHIDQVFLRFP